MFSSFNREPTLILSFACASANEKTLRQHHVQILYFLHQMVNLVRKVCTTCDWYVRARNLAYNCFGLAEHVQFFTALQTAPLSSYSYVYSPAIHVTKPHWQIGAVLMSCIGVGNGRQPDFATQAPSHYGLFHMFMMLLIFVLTTFVSLLLDSNSLPVPPERQYVS